MYLGYILSGEVVLRMGICVYSCILSFLSLQIVKSNDVLLEYLNILERPVHNWISSSIGTSSTDDIWIRSTRKSFYQEDGHVLGLMEEACTGESCSRHWIRDSSIRLLLSKPQQNQTKSMQRMWDLLSQQSRHHTPSPSRWM